MDPRKKFELEVADNVRRLGEDHDLQALSRDWSMRSGRYNYTYNFSWLGVPIILLAVPCYYGMQLAERLALRAEQKGAQPDA